MGEILACPFCRQLFSTSEGPICPECELKLVPLRALPPSHDALIDDLQEDESVDPPEDRALGAFYPGRGRGSLALFSSCQLILFFLPWANLLRPQELNLSGYELAAHFAPWLFAGAIGCVLLLVLLFARRTVNGLRGLRVIATFFASLTAGEASILLFLPPIENEYFSSGLSYKWGLYASVLFSILSSYTALRLGGSATDLRDLSVIRKTTHLERTQLH